LRAENEFKNYDLFGSYFNCVRTFIDSKGRIWAGVETENVLKYNEITDSWDEQKFVLNVSGKSDDDPVAITAITEDANNRLWIGSIEYGLMYFDENEEVFRQIEIANEEAERNFTLKENRITYLFSDSLNILWITTRNGIYKYNHMTKAFAIIEKYTQNQLSMWNIYNSISQDKKGNIWITNNFNGFLKFEGITDEYRKISFSGQNYSKEGKSDISLTHSLWDRAGILWIGSLSEGLIKYDPNKKHFIHYKHKKQNNKISRTTDIEFFYQKF